MYLSGRKILVVKSGKGNQHMAKMGRSELQDLIKQGEASVAHDVCYTCECFLGYLAQIRIDSHPADQDLFLPFKVDRSEMHGCLGCDPCPPGDLYAEYMKKRQTSKLIQI
jgi:hypothetical protein